MIWLLIATFALFVTFLFVRPIVWLWGKFYTPEEYELRIRQHCNGKRDRFLGNWDGREGEREWRMEKIDECLEKADCDY